MAALGINEKDSAMLARISNRESFEGMEPGGGYRKQTRLPWWAAILLLAIILTPASGTTGTGEGDAPESDRLEHISDQGREFIHGNLAMTLPGPLTVKLAQAMRREQAKRQSEALEKLAGSPGYSAKERNLGGVEVVVVESPVRLRPTDSPVVLYVHGGGYVLKSALDTLAVYMAEETGLPIVSVEYRLAPEHPFPAALEDCLAAYRGLLESYDPGEVVLLGGSAGGGLVLSTLLAAREQGLPLPRAVGLFSPWTDLTRTGDSYYFNEGRDPVLRWQGNLEIFARSYAGSQDLKDPLVSPVYGDYEGSFPKALIVTGTRDLFLSNCVRITRKIRRAGGDIRLEIWEEMFHGFELMPNLPEGAEARKTMATFLLESLSR